MWWSRRYAGPPPSLLLPCPTPSPTTRPDRGGVRFPLCSNLDRIPPKPLSVQHLDDYLLYFTWLARTRRPGRQSPGKTLRTAARYRGPVRSALDRTTTDALLPQRSDNLRVRGLGTCIGWLTATGCREVRTGSSARAGFLFSARRWRFPPTGFGTESIFTRAGRSWRAVLGPPPTLAPNGARVKGGPAAAANSSVTAGRHRRP